MSNYTLKPITETSWILQNEGNRVALIIKTEDELQIVGNKFSKKKFANHTELETFLGSKIEIEKHDDEEIAELGNVKGFPVKHINCVAIEEQDLPIYKRSNTSSILYCAGYYGVKFPNGWVTSYCPKLTTLTENEYIGPFQTKLEMQNSITQKKRQIDI